MSGAVLKHWAAHLWGGLVRGMCEAGTCLALQNGWLPFGRDDTSGPNAEGPTRG